MLNALNQADSLPFLFVGSGVSRRYLGHEGWEDLLTWAASLTGRPYGYFSGKTRKDLPATASLIAEAFYETWWSSPKYKASRDAWADRCRDVTSPLKIEVARRLAGSIRVKKSGLAKELKLLGSCQVDGIITTNYDNLLETVFPEYRVFVGQEDLLLSRSYQLAEIYKIHGSITEPESLVLCSDDYKRFDVTSPYLVAKLMSVFVEHPVVFLGYSLGDNNVRTILTSLLTCLSVERLEDFKSRFIWVDWDPTQSAPIVDDHVVDLGEGKLLPVIRVRTAEFHPVFEVLAGLERMIPVGILRRVAESVVSIVRSADPTRQIQVADLGNLEAFDDAEVVIGVGTHDLTSWQGAKGYLPINRLDLIADTLTDERGYLADEIVRTTLPALLRAYPKAWVPVRKYVRRAALPDDQLPESVLQAMKRRPSSNYSVPAGADRMALPDLVAEHGLTKALNLVVNFEPSSVNVSELRQLLADNLGVMSGGDANLGTAFAKATVLYDILADDSHQFDPAPARARTRAPAKSRGRARSGRKKQSATGKPSASDVRAWAQSVGRDVSARGPVSAALAAEFLRAQR